MLETEKNILVITGPGQDVGKSFVSANLAVVYAQSGNKVLLIDADMRKGYMQMMFSMEKENGLSEYLSRQTDRETAIRRSEVENLDFLPCGKKPPNPSELLMQPDFQELVNWATEKYDLVIIDSPPILAVTDATIIGRYAGINMLVVRHEKTLVKDVELAVRRCAQSGVQIKGCILNAVIRRASNRYYGYEHYSYRT
jgi:tyrosine-protein kinase Etk/Wzc